MTDTDTQTLLRLMDELQTLRATATDMRNQIMLQHAWKMLTRVLPRDVALELRNRTAGT